MVVDAPRGRIRLTIAGSRYAGTLTDATMTNAPNDVVERDDLAPAQRLHIIAALLAEGMRRKRADTCRMGENPQHQEREADGLESFESVRLDRPLG